jgi:hypothetical protein
MFHATALLKMTVFWNVAPCSLIETDISEVLTASIITLMMEAVSTSEMSVNFYKTTWRNIPEDSLLHTHHCENLKSHQLKFYQPRNMLI